jgi:hypothetical protein
LEKQLTSGKNQLTSVVASEQTNKQSEKLKTDRAILTGSPKEA